MITVIDIKISEMQALRDHLGDNLAHYFSAADEAIAHAKYGDYDHLIQVPEGKMVTALQIVQTLQLQDLVEPEFYDEDDDPKNWGV